ncbi:MAG: glycosyltransferase [Gemmataceae bacterium]
MRLTVGIPTYRDYDGTYFTLQSLRLHHDLSRWEHVELLVVDNDPASPEGLTLARLFEWLRGPNLSARHIPFTEATGTAPAKNRVFAEATGDVVLCVDSHVLLVPGALDALHDFFRQRPDSRDLVQGPLLYDHLDVRHLSTHFDDQWRGEMWGTWASDPRALGEEPFEIPAQGMGLFACRREAWLGFHPGFRGFGGEEHYIHEKFRQAGHRTWCLPRLRWLHRFNRPAGIPYKLTVEDKVRNYVLGHRELGLSLDRCRHHFVEEVRFPAERFDQIVAEVDGARTSTTSPPPAKEGKATLPPRQGCGCGRKPGAATQAELVRPMLPLPPAVRDLIAARSTVVEFSRWRGALFGEAMSAKVSELRSHTPGTPVALDGIDSRHGDTTILLSHRSPAESEPAQCQLLVIGWELDADGVYQALQRHGPSCTERIVLAGTQERGETWEGRPGILPAVRRWLTEHPEWTVREHVREGDGYLLLTRLAEEKKQLPPTWKQAWNVLSAAWRNQSTEVLSGYGPLAGTPEQETRLAECTLCPSRNEGRCGECGCPIEKKTSWAQEQCPLGKWTIATISDMGASSAT